MAGVAFNIVILGFTGLLSLPALTNFFAVPTPEKITVNIGIGALNSSAPLPSGLSKQPMMNSRLCGHDDCILDFARPSIALSWKAHLHFLLTIGFARL